MTELAVVGRGVVSQKPFAFPNGTGQRADGAAKFTFPSSSLNRREVTSAGLPRTTEEPGAPAPAARAWGKRVRKTHFDPPTPLDLFLSGWLLFLICHGVGSRLARLPFLGAERISQLPGLESCVSSQIPEDSSRGPARDFPGKGSMDGLGCLRYPRRDGPTSNHSG